MKIADFTIEEVLHAVEETVVARARSDGGETVVLKYQDTNRPSLDISARWQHEHDVLRTIDSPWIIKALGMRQIDTRQVLVLEYFTSTNLAQLIAEHDLDLASRIAIALQLTAAVSDVHRHRLIHGDISAKNVLVDVAALRLKLCDFGLCTRLQAEQKQGRETFLRGTLEYMSPEQTGRTDLAVDYRSDFYSLGVTLYELFLGHKPFQTNDPMALLHAHIAIMPLPLHEADPAIPRPISDIVQKLLAKFPDDRYQSSHGLTTDLEHCAHQWQQNWRIDPFALARADISERFCVSQRLVGREAQSQTILDAFERVSTGRAELLLIDGYSGVGKTALVNELHRPILQRHGYFIRGKCDQYSRNQPFAALIQAFTPLMRQLLGEGAQRRHYWKTELLRALGDNASAITDIIPNLAQIIGEPAPLQALPAAEQENRFHIAFAQFVRVLSSSGHPLALFLDDLQWVDLPTLRLIEGQILRDEDRALLIIGAYRDNEVDDSHALTRTLHTIELAQAPLRRVHLAPLGLAHVTQLISRTLRRGHEDVAALAGLCLQKTAGNPFFLKQFLGVLHEGGAIQYDHPSGGWAWDMAKVAAHGVSDNVVDLMLAKLRQLTPATQALLSLAAHLGNSFDMQQLMAAQRQDAVPTAALLWPALHSGLVVPLGDDYKFDGTPQKLESARYRFLHDRVQQAAWSLTPQGERQALQLRVGRLLLAHTPDDELEERLFLILQQLNSAASLITDAAERAALLALNLRAGIKAKAASAHPAAVGLLRQALDLQGADAWQRQPQQTLSVYKELAEALYLAGDFAAAEQLYPEAIACAPHAVDKVTLCLVQADQYHIQGRFKESLPVLLQALSLLGEDFPASDAQAGPMFPVEFAKTEVLLARGTHADLLAQQEMTSPERLLEMRIYYSLSFASYQTGQFGLFLVDACRMVQATLKHGQCDLSCIAYVAYMTAMSAMGKPYPLCYQMGTLALALAEAGESKYFRLTIYQYFSAFYQHWCEPLDATFEFLDRGLEWGQEGINPLSAGYCALLRSANRFAQGVTLEALQSDCEQGLSYLQNSHQSATEAMLRYGVWLPVMALQGKTLGPLSFETGDFSAAEFFKGDWQTPSIPLALYSTAMTRHAYLLQDAALWARFSANLAVIGSCLPDSPALVDATFYTALGLLNQATASVVGSAQAATATPAENLAQAVIYRDKFQTWAQDCEANFGHKYLLIAAEVARVQGEDKQAMDLYARAIDAARLADNTACEALANELYARFWLGQQQKQLASNFIQEAHYHYARWGASVKCDWLEEKWPHIVFGASERRRVASGKTTTYKQVSGKADSLDLHSLLKAHQLLAQEVSLDALLPKMMGVVLENAGAQRGAIVLADEGLLSVQALGTVAAGQRVQSQRVGLSLMDACEGDAPMLPQAIIAHVRDTHDTLVLSNAVHDDRFLGDPYLARRAPKSLMCVPIVSHGKLVAVLYLENNLMENAFTGKHLQTLELLSSQAAISIVNAKLYDQLEEKVLERTEQLQITFEQLQQERAAQARLMERQRIMRDLHDGVGAQLVGLLNLIKQPHAEHLLEEHVQAAMDEMRMAVDSMQLTDGDLTTALAMMRYRVQPRLRGAGLAMHWDVQPVTALDGQTPHFVLQVQRILSEALTNILKHAKARNVWVSCAINAGGDSVVLEVADDGRGLGEREPGYVGHGLRNMQARAESIGATLSLTERDGGGLRVAVTWPALNTPAPSDQGVQAGGVVA